MQVGKTDIFRKIVIRAMSLQRVLDIPYASTKGHEDIFFTLFAFRMPQT